MNGLPNNKVSQKTFTSKRFHLIVVHLLLSQIIKGCTQKIRTELPKASLKFFLIDFAIIKIRQIDDDESISESI
jgi:hypothetical protein